MSSLLAILLLALQAWSPSAAEARPTVPSSPPVVLVAPRIPTRGTAAISIPAFTAESAVVLDAASGVVLYGKRPYAVRPFASITKLLAALVLVRDGPAWDDVLTLTATDIPSEGNTVLHDGDRVTQRDLLTAMLVRSDNAAARALARARGIGFLERMRALARSYGLTTIRIVDPTGLASGNRGTAVDAARLLHAAFGVPELAERLRLAEAAIVVQRPHAEELAVRTTNLLLRDGEVRPFTIIGGKTGYLDEAGFNLAIVVERNGHRMIVAVLGSATHENRFRDAETLAAWVFRNYEW